MREITESEGAEDGERYRGRSVENAQNSRTEEERGTRRTFRRYESHWSMVMVDGIATVGRRDGEVIARRR